MGMNADGCLSRLIGSVDRCESAVMEALISNKNRHNFYD